MMQIRGIRIFPDTGLRVQNKNHSNIRFELGYVIPENISKNILESDFYPSLPEP